MWIFLIIFLGVVHKLKCSDVSSLSEYDSLENREYNKYEQLVESYEGTTVASVETTSVSTEPSVNRRYWLVTARMKVASDNEENEKDAKLKSKITTLVEQTLDDTQRKLRTIQMIKEKYNGEAPYKVGFILSLIKKTKDILNELFNVAVKHRDDFKALEQLKIFELIVHTNVDTTNLVRQMIEMHIEFFNSTNVLTQRNRVVLL